MAGLTRSSETCDRGGWIFNEARWTRAGHSLVDHLADGVGTAHIVPGARVHALVRQTGFIRVAIFLDSTAQSAHVVEANVSQKAIVV